MTTHHAGPCAETNPNQTHPYQRRSHNADEVLGTHSPTAPAGQASRENGRRSDSATSPDPARRGQRPPTEQETPGHDPWPSFRHRHGPLALSGSVSSRNRLHVIRDHVGLGERLTAS